MIFGLQRNRIRHIPYSEKHQSLPTRPPSQKIGIFFDFYLRFKIFPPYYITDSKIFYESKVWKLSNL